MILLRKNFVLECLQNLTVDFVENFIESMGFKPLRWAVVEIRDEKYVIDAVVIK